MSGCVSLIQFVNSDILWGKLRAKWARIVTCPQNQGIFCRRAPPVAMSFLQSLRDFCNKCEIVLSMMWSPAIRLLRFPDPMRESS